MAAMAENRLQAMTNILQEDKLNTSVQQDAFHIFLLMGQSNMAGYGKLLPEDYKEIDGTYMLRDGGKLEKYSWLPAKQPIHCRLESDRFCLAGPFAKAHRGLYPRIAVGLIPMAWRGAAITKMNKGTSFYQEMVDKALWAKKQGKLKALLWHQGESDTIYEEAAGLYEDRLIQLINDIRKDLDEPDLMVIIGNLAEFYGTGKEHSDPQRVKCIDKVKSSLRKVAEKMSNVVFVESTGLRSHDHHQVHFGRESYVILGNVIWMRIGLI